MHLLGDTPFLELVEGPLECLFGYQDRPVDHRGRSVIHGCKLKRLVAMIAHILGFRRGGSGLQSSGLLLGNLI